MSATDSQPPASSTGSVASPSSSISSTATVVQPEAKPPSISPDNGTVATTGSGKPATDAGSATTSDSKRGESSTSVQQSMNIHLAQSGLAFFSPEDNLERKLTREDEMNHAASFVYDPEFVMRAVTVLTRHRFILISGEPESGKLSMAMYLANRLREDGSIPEDTFVYSPYSRDVKISPPDLANQKKLHGRIVIFRDALDFRNSTLLRFLGSGEAISSVTRGFENAGCYVIFTVSHHTLPPECHGALQEDLRPTLHPVGEMLLCPGIEALVQRFCGEESHSQWKEKEVEAETIQKIAAWAITMSRACQFFNLLFGEVLGGLPLDEAFRRFDTLIPWFRKNALDTVARAGRELRLHREAWIYCLALVVAQPLGGEGVPCYEFSLIYEALRRHLLGSSRFRLSRRAYCEIELQELSHAVVVRQSAKGKDVLTFKDTRVADRLWVVLLTNFRSLALNLISPLVKLAEQPGTGRARAAQAIGRIGLIDVEEISQRLLYRWAEKEDGSLMGYLAQGALRTGDLSYRKSVLLKLENLPLSNEKAWKVVAAYKEIGTIEIELALDKLKPVVEFVLRSAFEKSQDAEKTLVHFEEQLINANTEEEAIESMARINALFDLYEKMFPIAHGSVIEPEGIRCLINARRRPKRRRQLFPDSRRHRRTVDGDTRQ
jgi:hypothetical protein